MILIGAQGVVRQLAGMFSAMADDKDLTPPAGMPDRPAFVGISIVASADGLRLDLAVPSVVGPVIEEGMIPLFQKLQQSTPR